ncbi:MAG: hypothetical protein IJ729_06250, partial [Alloprevotella sp.]|nr:hypothetical protein [Alloprevotella sp.]
TLTHNLASDKTVTPTEGVGTIDKQDDGTTVTINVTDINATEASFVYSGTNDGLVGTLTIRYHRVALPAYVTYIVNDEGGNEVARYTDIEVEDGAEISELPAEYRKTFMTYTYGAPVTAVYGTPVTFTATEAGYNLPFTVSTEGNETWYILKAGNYYSYVGNKSTSYSGRNTNYYYAFFGSPETGFTIKNGNGKFINHNTTAWSSPITMSDEGAVFMIEEAEGGFRMRTDHATEPSRILYLGYYSGYTPFTVWTDLKSANDGILHAIPVGITNLESLSNNKKYTLTTERGTLGTDNGALASTIKGFAAREFAIINFSGSYYLYSVSDQKFVDASGNLTEDPTTTASFTGNAPFLGKLGSNGINISSGYDPGVIVNSWTTADAGNMYAIEEVGDFDPTAALAKLQTVVYNSLITELEGVNYGTALGQYGLTGEYAGYETQMATILDGLKTQGYTAENMAIVQGLGDATALNMPANGSFIRVVSAEGKYLSSAEHSSGRIIQQDNADNYTIYYFKDGKLLNYGAGIYGNGRDRGSVGADGLSNYTFQESELHPGAGLYILRFNPDGGNLRYLYCWPTSQANYPRTDQNSSDAEPCQLTLEAVTELPVTISAAGWATLNLPVATEIPEGVTAYVGKIEGEMLNFSEVSGVIPANTPVILEAAADTYDFAITDEEGTVEAGYDALIGTIAAQTCAAEEYYTLQDNAESGIGMYPYSGTTLTGFKAYMSAATAAGVRGFSFGGAQTGIGGVEAAGESRATIYDLQGRRVQQSRKGVYVVNGKKVMF